VQEFKVQTGSYTAEMGGAGGGPSQYRHANRTNQLHGTAYEFLRNNVLDARSFNQMDSSNHLVETILAGRWVVQLSGIKRSSSSTTKACG